MLLSETIFKPFRAPLGVVVVFVAVALAVVLTALLAAFSADLAVAWRCWASVAATLAATPLDLAVISLWPLSGGVVLILRPSLALPNLRSASFVLFAACSTRATVFVVNG